MIAILLATMPFLDCPRPDKRCSHSPLVQAQQEDVMIFMSFSVPVETWKDLSVQLEQIGGRFVVRGIPDNSFEAFASKVMALREAGVLAQIDLDPDLFARYEVKEVPYLVVKDKRRYDAILGNLRLDEALRIMAESGDAAEKERQLLERL